MRVVQVWWRSLVWSSRENPPQFVELTMLLLAVVALGLWCLRPEWPYLALNISYILGAFALMLVQEMIRPSPHSHTKRTIATILLLMLLAALGTYCSETLKL